ncbi:MAG: PaaI family thioesterase [Alphaproteobacteria bacterium]|nr:PaaI family thioesterase [Alphaproteobacteria bacterium]
MKQIKGKTGAQTLIGYVVEIEDGRARVVLDITPHHLNRNSGLHGGIIATLLDAAAGYAASLEGDGNALTPVTTVSMTVNYVSKVDSGLVTGTGKVTGGGHKILFADAELTTADGRTVATATGTFKRLPMAH